jgi:hypothetical protein
MGAIHAAPRVPCWMSALLLSVLRVQVANMAAMRDSSMANTAPDAEPLAPVLPPEVDVAKAITEASCRAASCRLPASPMPASSVTLMAATEAATMAALLVNALGAWMVTFWEAHGRSAPHTVSRWAPASRAPLH